MLFVVRYYAFPCRSMLKISGCAIHGNVVYVNRYRSYDDSNSKG